MKRLSKEGEEADADADADADAEDDDVTGEEVDAAFNTVFGDDDSCVPLHDILEIGSGVADIQQSVEKIKRFSRTKSVPDSCRVHLDDCVPTGEMEDMLQDVGITVDGGEVSTELKKRLSKDGEMPTCVTPIQTIEKLQELSAGGDAGDAGDASTELPAEGGDGDDAGEESGEGEDAGDAVPAESA